MEAEISPLEKTVIDNIRSIRQEKGITQLRLSIFSGTSASYIGLMETYKNIPKLSTIERIADALDVPVLELFMERKSKSGKTNGKTEEVAEREQARKQKLREHLKQEFIARIENDVDDLLQMI
ncbi:MAG: helix-turn-helix domain-containing protein [Treponemataceae bacterium]|nr:helix-turn-helix domain-containing protein [Treponemataceae bacterium]MDE7291490.1 helix-turn-helix domain-containing protein [Treponemataceae bacterium]